MPALRAPQDMPAQRRRAAGRQVVQGPPLLGCQSRAIRLEELLGTTPDHLGHVEPGADHDGRPSPPKGGRRSSGLDVPCSRAVETWVYARRGAEVAVPEQDLDRPHIGAGLEQVGGEAVAQRMGADVLGQARGPHGRPADPLHGGMGDGPIGFPAGEQVGAGPDDLPVAAEEGQEARREHDLAILAALALADADDHAAAVDVLDAQRGDLGEPQAGGVGGHEDGAVLEVADGGEELGDLVEAEDDGELPGGPGTDDAIVDPSPLEGGAVEEAECGAGLIELGPGGPLLDEVEEIGADVVGPEVLGRGAEVPREGGDAIDIGIDGAIREVPEAHVLDHATAQRGHVRVLRG